MSGFTEKEVSALSFIQENRGQLTMIKASEGYRECALLCVKLSENGDEQALIIPIAELLPDFKETMRRYTPQGKSELKLCAPICAGAQTAHKTQ